MKTVLITAILASASPLAFAQSTNDAAAGRGHAITQPLAMAGAPASAPVKRAIEDRITGKALETALSGELHPEVIEDVRQAYTQTRFKPVWTRKGSAALEKAAASLSEHGLDGKAIFKTDLAALADQRFKAKDDAKRAEADLALSAAWLRLAAALSGGLKAEAQDEKVMSNAGIQAGLSEKLIEAGRGETGDITDALAPKTPQYQALKAALQTYRGIREAGGWLAIPDGEVIEAGQSDPRIPAIRERLAIEGYDAQRSILDMVTAAIDVGQADDPASASDTALIDRESARKALDPLRYDMTLVEAVKAFQARHGIEPDGVIGPSTLAAMNESVDSKIDRIIDSMNRWRAQGPMAERYVWANIPSYTVEGWKDGQREIAMKSIVGMASRETPTFSDEIEYAVANPRWYTPASIVRKDKLPKLRRDPAYAERGNYRIYDRATGEEVSTWSINWNDPASAEKYRLVQMSGAGNALGELKIMFPNQYAVYLHGTPGEHLFKRAERALSSGCIRLEEPVAMASWIAGLDSRVEAEKLQEAVNSNNRKRFEFKSRVPVHITYMTVTVDDDGTVNFWRDIYGETGGIRQVDEAVPLEQPQRAVETANLG